MRLVVQLVQNGVERDRGLPRLPVTDDKLSLTAADRDHGVNRFNARVHRSIHPFTFQNRGRLRFKRIPLRRRASLKKRAFAVLRVAQWIYHAADKFIPDGNREHVAGALYGIPHLDRQIIIEHQGADGLFFKVQSERRARTLRRFNS